MVLLRGKKVTGVKRRRIEDATSLEKARKVEKSARAQGNTELGARVPRGREGVLARAHVGWLADMFAGGGGCGVS